MSKIKAVEKIKTLVLCSVTPPQIVLFMNNDKFGGGREVAHNMAPVRVMLDM